MTGNDQCRKCHRLRKKRAMSSLSLFEEQWLENHWQECADCATLEAAEVQAMRALRGSSQAEVEIASDFDEKLVRRLRLDRGSRTLAYWSPVFVGAALAGIAALALIQVVSFRPQPRPAVLEGREARRVDLPVIPDPGFTIER
ncbi:MAG: hypothetical protein AB7F50_06900 [Fimbriimonadaceae bacterium]